METELDVAFVEGGNVAEIVDEKGGRNKNQAYPQEDGDIMRQRRREIPVVAPGLRQVGDQKEGRKFSHVVCVMISRYFHNSFLD